MRKLYNILILITALIALSGQQIYAQCMSTEGETFQFNASDYNDAQEFSNLYILTDYKGKIIQTASVHEFVINERGLYKIYGINYKTSVGIFNTNIGNNISDVIASCIDISEPMDLIVCSPTDNGCDTFDGHITFDSVDADTTLFTSYLLTNLNQEILQISSNTNFENIPNGTFLIFSLKYSEVNEMIPGNLISDIKGVNIDFGNPWMFKSCAACNVNIGEDIELCGSQTILLTANADSDGTFLWSTGETESSVVVNPTQTTKYTVSYTNSLGCVALDSIMITIHQQPVVDAGPDKSICEGESVVLSIDQIQGASFRWSTGETTSSIEVNPSVTTTYSIQVEQGICSDYDEIKVTVNSIPDVSIEGSRYVCNGQSTILEANGGNAFLWSTGETTSSITIDPIEQTTYTVTVTNAENCSATDTITVSTENCGRIGNFVWEDYNANGIQDEGEPGMEGVEINLIGNNIYGKTVNLSTFTNSEGTYGFEYIYPGTYELVFIVSDTYKVSPINMGTDSNLDSDVNPNKRSDLIVIGSGFDNQSYDAGFYLCGKIMGNIWIDKGTLPNIYDEGDEDFNGIEIQLYSSDNPNEPLQTTFTQNIDSVSGRYAFEIYVPNTYFIKVIRPQDYKFVSPLAGNGSNDSKIKDSITGKTDSFYIGYGHLQANINAGLIYSPLVVTLLDFTGFWDTQKDVNVLKWRTTSEINNDYFELERSFEMEPFTKIGQIKGQGNSTTLHEYKYEDPDIQRNGMYSYRLKQVDFDGQYTFSNVVRIPIFREINGFTTVLYPNPTFDNSTLEIHSNKGIKIKVEIFDGVGRLCYPFVFDTVLDDEVVKIPLDKLYLPKGLYHIKVSSDDQISTLKWMVLK